MKHKYFACVPMALLGCLLCSSAAAQERPRPQRPTRPDSLAADSLARRARPDSLPADTLVIPTATDTLGIPALATDTLGEVADTAVPPPRFGAIVAGPRPVGVAGTDFYWNRDALLREGAVTLSELLEHIPGMTAIRAGVYQQPEIASPWGQTRGRIEVVLDGYVLDPFTTATLDLGELELAQMEELRVERRLDLTRIHISTVEPAESVPYSRIEAATGEPNGNVFRAIFTAPYVIAGPLALSLDRVDSDGRTDRELRGQGEEADILGIWGKWAYFAQEGARAVQLEFRQSRLRRLRNVPWTADQTRRDVVLRARNRFFEGLTGELFVGNSSLDRAPADSLAAGDSIRELGRDAWQYGVRAALRRGPAWLDAELRLRDSDALPARQFDVSGGLEVGRFLRLAGSATNQSWRAGEGAAAFDVRAELGPFAGFGAFAELAGGTRGAPLYEDSLGISTLEDHTIHERSGSRIGLFARPWGTDVTAAYVQLEADSAVSFGLPFDADFPGAPVSNASGVEVFGRLPLWPRGLSITGSYNYWDNLTGWLYLPSRSWRVAAELHTLPLASDNLEIFGRLEHLRRGSMLVPNPSFDPELPESLPTVALGTSNLLNGYLQIRIIDVRAFIAGYDLLGGVREDLVGRDVGPRIIYGVKWQLFN